jgi:4-hydroxy-3-methylbut-2-enyl diphosphate reductase
MEIIIDPGSGCCPGVNRILKVADQFLEEEPLVSLGEIIHNTEELRRLQKKGMKIVHDPASIQKKDEKVLIRAHGVPKRTYHVLQKNDIRIIDGTCPIVKRSERIAEEYSRNGYQILFIGKKGHAETISVTGHADGEVVVIENEEDFHQIDVNKPSIVFAQTTVKETDFLNLTEKIQTLMKNELIIKNSICGFVKNRDRQIAEFAGSVDVIIMVGGKHSSNTKWLYSICKKNNPSAYWIESTSELKEVWFAGANKIGITGSASTPMWQIEDVKHAIENLRTA